MQATTQLPSDPRQRLAALHAEQKRRQWLRDPVLWAKERLGRELWSGQKRIVEAVRDHRHVAVRSSFDTGKSFAAGGILVPWWIDVHPPGEAFCVTCYADDVEVFTRAGWKLFKDVEVGENGDEFATRNQLTKEFEWQTAHAKQVADYTGKMVDLNNVNGFHLRVTPNHRVLARWSTYIDGIRTDGEFFKPADKITQRGVVMPMHSVWSAESPQTVKFGRYEWTSNDFAAFLGAWLAEGSLSRRTGYVRNPKSRKYTYHTRKKGMRQGVINITQLENTKGYEPYRELLARMLGREPLRAANNFTFWCPDLWDYLRKLGTSSTKYIPTEIKDWSRADLATLFKFYWLGDGSTSSDQNGNNALRASTVSRQLADDMQEIAQKIGMSASITARQPVLGGVIEGRQIVSRRVSYGICFNVSGGRHVKPTKVPYSGKVYCVSVPNETLYVRVNGRPVWCGNSASTEAQVKAILWHEIAQSHATGKLIGRLNQTEWWANVNGVEQMVGFGRKPADTNATAFQGLHRKYVLVILDEAAGIPGLLWDAAEGLVSNEFSRLLAIGNPEDPLSEFATVSRPGSGWHSIKISAFDTPAFTGERVSQHLLDRLVSKVWVEERKKRWGVDNPKYVSKVLGEFPEVSENCLILPGWVLAAQERTLTPMRPSELGVDVGAGGDKTVIAHRRGPVVRIVHRERQPDTMKACGNVTKAMNVYGAEVAKVDEIGVGKGLVDRAKELHYNVIGVNVGKAADRKAKRKGKREIDEHDDSEQFLNRRAQGYWHLRELFLTGEIDIDPADEELAAQLVDIKYERLSNGTIKIESKEEMKRRKKAAGADGESPDEADAVMLAFMPATTLAKSSATWGTGKLGSGRRR